MSNEGEAESAGEDEYDPFEHVPGRIDAISASGLIEMHEALNELNTARLESLPVEGQAVMLWNMVEKGVIDVDLTEGRR
jgi:riboflavin biosynthesis pyrimidine reductase